MTTVIGIRFTSLGRIHYFDSLNQDLKFGDTITVETDGEHRTGIVVLSHDQITFSSIKNPLIPVVLKETNIL